MNWLWSRWREKRCQHSQRMRDPRFNVSGRRPVVGVAARPCGVNVIHLDNCKPLRIFIPCSQRQELNGAYHHSVQILRSNHSQRPHPDHNTEYYIGHKELISLNVIWSRQTWYIHQISYYPEALWSIAITEFEKKRHHIVNVSRKTIKAM